MDSHENITSTGGIPPLYMKHQDLGLGQRENISVYEICKAMYEIIDRKEIEGAQKVGGLWRIYLNSTEARAQLLVQGYTFRGKSIPLSENNPYQSRDGQDMRRHVKVTVQNMPLSVANSEVDLLISRLGAKIEKKAEYEYELDENKKITTIKNGNRIVYVNGGVRDDPLPRFTFLGNWRCGVYHYGQKPPEKQCYRCLETGHLKSQCINNRACRTCRKTTHKEGSEDCEFYQENDCFPFQGPEDPLSNFYSCQMNWSGIDVHSSEQAYGCSMAEETDQKRQRK